MHRPPSSPDAPRAPGTSAPPLGRDELVRYARHLALADVGTRGQARLKAARVLVVGTGGLGSPVALYLAAAGVGTLGLVDDDTVELTNLQRQVAHGTSALGERKVASAAARVRDLNPHVDVETFDTRLTRANALRICRGWDLIVDGSDNFPTRYLVNDAGVLLGIPVVYGAILRWEGQVSLWGADGGPCYRCIFREPPPPGLVPSCADAGVVGALAGVVGTLQALEVIKRIVGVGDGLAGRLLIFDGRAARWREVEVPRDPACPVCGDAPSVTELVDYEHFCGVEAGSGPAPQLGIGPTELEAALAGDAPPLIVDVREQWEWDAGNLKERGAVHVPLAELPVRMAELPTDRVLVVVCSVGARSAGAAAHLRERGRVEAVNLRGGLRAWADVVDPTLDVV